MEHIYYFFTIFAIMYELFVFGNTRKFINFKKSMKDGKFDDYTTNQKTFNVLAIFYLIWVFIGIMTSQWILFLFLIMLSIIPLKRNNNIFLLKFNSLVSAMILLLILLNKYHLNFDFSEMILNYFK